MPGINPRMTALLAILADEAARTSLGSHQKNCGIIAEKGAPHLPRQITSNARGLCLAEKPRQKDVMTRRTEIHLCGEALIPDPLGALYWAAGETLIVSDLHFEKGTSFARKGIMLPPFDTRATIMRIEALLRRYKPVRVISLGDAFHDTEAEARIEEEDAARIEAMTRDADWLWILGNHDPEPPARFVGTCEREAQIGPLIFRHEPKAGFAPGEICGHLHPCARIVTEGRALRRRCFAAGDDRLVMPALGAFTGGLNILNEAFAGIAPDPIAWVMGAEGVYRVTRANLVPDVRRHASRKAG